jgi:predicted acylesterase/phospholipase RssA
MSNYLAKQGGAIPAEDFYRRLKPEGKRLVLSIDGGGSRGYITLHCLAKLEELCGKSCHEIFDFYVGTSTGSLIAAGLAVGMSAQTILHLYKNRIPDVFDESINAPLLTRLGIEVGAWIISLFRSLPARKLKRLKKYASLLARHDWKYMYSHQKLKEICEEFLTNQYGNPLTLGDLYQGSVDVSNGRHTKRLLVTIKDVQRSETLFVVNAGPGAKAFENMLLVDAVVASSVAPIFFEPLGVWVDGGVGSYGNPCYEATVEATEYFTGLRKPTYELKHDDSSYHHDNVIHFSFGTGMRPNNIRDEEKVRKMLFDNWLVYLISEGQDDANNNQVRLTEDRFSRGNNWYSAELNHRRVDFRRYQLVLNPELLMKPISAGGLGMTLTSKDWELIRGLEMNSRQPEELELMKRIGRAWADAIGGNFARPHYPYVNQAEAYTPPASPPGRVRLPLRQYVDGLYQ